jgi:site-specific recombinase XerD
VLLPPPGPESASSARISNLVPEFLDHLRVEARRSPNTLVRYRDSLAEFSKALSDCSVDTFTSDRISLYKRVLFDRGLGPATVSAKIAALRSFLRYLREVKGWNTYDPERVKRPTVPTRAVSYLAKDEVLRFLEAIPTHRATGARDRALAEIICSTGMRISEVLSLNRTDVDWEKREAIITGKGQKERRVYFTAQALGHLARYLSVRHDDHPAVFVTQGNDPDRLAASDVWSKFRRYGIRAGLAKRISPHMLRHTMATTLLANGCPIGHIKTLLGHSHLQTTCRYYLGVISDAEAKAAHGKFLAYDPDATDSTEETKKP